MDLAVALMLLAYMIMSWRLICRFVVAKGGKRWVGHGLGAIFGPLLGVIAALPVVPGKEEPATFVHVVIGSLILVVFLLAEYRTKQNWTAPVKLRTAKARKQEQKAQLASTGTGQESEPKGREGLTFSLRDTAELILADDVVDQREAELLLNLLDKQEILNFDPACRELHQVLIASLDDGVLDNDEAEEIKAILSEICDRPIARPAKPEPKKKAVPKNPAAKATPKPKRSKPATRPSVTAQRKPEVGDILAFAYTDSKGDTSDREVEFRAMTKKNGVSYLKGICLSRRAFRTFRSDRMDFVCFADTGETLF
ncbi:WYL domain-containing protein [Marinobacter nauticus]|uniref:WYL domain-containing protein n=1 Tax=Marinobacter nauticus TaxID=2743 RepID=UPI001C98E8B2|nr:WYL domain-containing protein [Marinobacter nauticus]MBY5938034.1 hypothetical protein [Marinobacter nauticus]MBY5955263.1 hypothetical protein [Marinobacter nauticus]MBY6009054.1 hypothetical protein [Marinobacter nauticus]